MRLDVFLHNLDEEAVSVGWKGKLAVFPGFLFGWFLLLLLFPQKNYGQIDTTIQLSIVNFSVQERQKDALGNTIQSFSDETIQQYHQERTALQLPPGSGSSVVGVASGGSMSSRPKPKPKFANLNTTYVSC